MIAGLDSAYPPNDSSIAQAYAAGIRLWAGYFAGPNILNGWTQADFDRVKAGGMNTLAFCSGWSDPVAMKAQSAAWGVSICLDVESGIRAFIFNSLGIPRMRNGIQRRLAGSWVPPWLTASGAGLYGNAPVFPGQTAAYYIFAAYGLDPQVTWPTQGLVTPTGLKAWQWQGSHTAFGITVDSAWYDNGFQQTFGPGTGTLEGGLDMAIADQILAAVTMPLPTKPASVASHTDADLINIANTTNWADILTAFGQDGENYIYALTHPTYIRDAVVVMKAEIDALKTGQPVDLSGITAAITAIKNEEDALLAKVNKDLA